MAKTATATKSRTDAPPPPPNNGAVALAGPRLPYHPAVQERFGVSRAEWKVLCEAVWPLAKTPEGIILALAYCKSRNLDPLKRVVHIVPIYNSKTQREEETVWPGIAEHRTTAQRTGNYAGLDAPRFGPSITRTFTGRSRLGFGRDAAWKDDEPVEVTFPEWCEMTLYRMVQGHRVPFPGPRVYWLEYYNKKGRASEIPNEQWHRRPSYMLEKCAEAGALRRAFPEELGDEFTVEEVGFWSRSNDAKAVEAEVVSTAEPTRAEFNNTGQADGDDRGQPDSDHDADTGEARGNGGKPADDGQAKGDAGQPAGDGAKQEAVTPWYPPVVGQDAITKAIVKLIKDEAKSAADLDAIDKVNAERVAKFTQANRVAITAALEDRREDFKEGGQ